MASTDPIADFLTHIRNGLQAGHESVEVPHSKIKEEIARILEKEGYLGACKLTQKEAAASLTVVLKYGPDREPVIRSLRRVSKPGRRIYAGKDEIPRVLGGLGIAVLSTSQGVLTSKAARQLGIGGEVLCEVY